MCDCISGISDRAFELAVNKNEGGVTGGHFVQVSHPIRGGNIMPSITYSEFEYTFIPTKKDGTHGKPKRKILTLNHSYCPFCGEKYPE